MRPVYGLLDHPLRMRVALPLLLLLVALPWIAHVLGADYYTGVASRMLIFALAASSLNFILGFGGMVSFGHAAFFGVGGYAVGIMMQYGIASAWISWPVAVIAGAGLALVIGAVSLRTRGVYFIMITLAFAQMVFYLMVSLKAFGGTDGMTLTSRSSIVPGLDLSDGTQFYYVVLGVGTVAFVVIARVLNARFGHVLQAIHENETRAAALGYPVYRYKLVAFSFAGAVAGLAGALMANKTGFVSPALLDWQQSGVFMVMVILGGVGRLYGGLIGAIVFLLIQEVASTYTIHWQFILGAILLAVVLYAPNGVISLFRPGATS